MHLDLVLQYTATPHSPVKPPSTQTQDADYDWCVLCPSAHLPPASGDFPSLPQERSRRLSDWSLWSFLRVSAQDHALTGWVGERAGTGLFLKVQ